MCGWRGSIAILAGRIIDKGTTIRRKGNDKSVKTKRKNRMIHWIEVGRGGRGVVGR